MVGEPKWLWSRLTHPVVLMGRLIDVLERRFNRSVARKAVGAGVLIVLVLVSACLGLALESVPLGPVFSLLLAAILLAQNSLASHVTAVAQALEQSVSAGRVAVAAIVGRDTGAMEGDEIARAAIESAAENLSDGVVAPAFWYLIAGLPGILVYKMVNTADSMIGYRTDRYADFGWAAARFDDLINWLPARLCALMIWLVHGGRGRWRAISADARRHRSPNAGWPEAAAARALDVALSGPRRYDGALRDYPFVNPDGRRMIGAQDIRAAVRLLWRTWAAGLAVVFAIAGFSFA